MKKSTGATSLEGAIAGMQALKSEHAPILAQLARDVGMSPETRELLVAHLLEEEDEKLATIATAAKSRATGAGVSSGAASGARFTIGRRGRTRKTLRRLAARALTGPFVSLETDDDLESAQ
jgi:hypothetical protein